MNNEPYTTIESGVASPEKQKEFCTINSLGYKSSIPDRCIEGPLFEGPLFEGPLFEALLWDYFHQHFYEWVRL